MTEEKVNLLDLQKNLIENGSEDIVASDFIEKTKRKIHLLTFQLDKQKKNISAQLNGMIVFVDSKFPGKVEVGDTWICTAELAQSGTAYYAMPIYKVTAALLMNLNNDLRKDMIDSLWRRNKKIFEGEFAERYKGEIHDAAINEARNELGGIISELQTKVSSLELQLEQNRILNQTNAVSAKVEPYEIELGSEPIDTGCIELGSETTFEQVTPMDHSPQAIPSTHRYSTPGIPEIRAPEKRSISKPIVFRVDRLDEETLYSESFTDSKYFVHISPDCKLLVVRPNDFGSVFCINNKVKLKGLGGMSPFTEAKRLMAEYSDRYEGMIIYL